jgi:hypothetical protein
MAASVEFMFLNAILYPAKMPASRETFDADKDVVMYMI